MMNTRLAFDKRKGWRNVLASSGMTLAALYFSLSSHGVHQTLSWICAVTFAVITLVLARAIVESRNLGIQLSEDGIFDRSSPWRSDFIPWSQLLRVYSHSRSGISFVVLERSDGRKGYIDTQTIEGAPESIFAVIEAAPKFKGTIDRSHG